MSCIAKIRSIVPYLSLAVVDLWAVILSLSEKPLFSCLLSRILWGIVWLQQAGRLINPTMVLSTADL